MARKAAATGEILRLKVTLAGLRPPVWRRLLLPANMTLSELHAAIQAVMGWDNSHLHDFAIGNDRYGDIGTTDDVDDERKLTLADIRAAGVSRLRYTYDFGDDWVHDILIEAAVPRSETQRYPACIGGRQACPPEDSGGPYGLAEMLAARADPAHPDHAEIAQWLGPDYDPTAFSVAVADATLGARFNRRTAKR